MRKAVLIAMVAMMMAGAGCKSMNPCGCGGKKCASAKAECTTKCAMKCAKCDATKEECCDKNGMCKNCDAAKDECCDKEGMNK